MAKTDILAKNKGIRPIIVYFCGNLVSSLLLSGLLQSDLLHNTTMSEIYDFYNNGAEIGRLERGLGIVEFHRTKEILSRYIDKGKVVYDIGGGIGMYAAWLAKKLRIE